MAEGGSSASMTFCPESRHDFSSANTGKRQYWVLEKRHWHPTFKYPFSNQALPPNRRIRRYWTVIADYVWKSAFLARILSGFSELFTAFHDYLFD
jgi:hypothetical protein